MDLYQRMSDRSMAKLYWIARHCGDFATANDILQALKQRTESGARCTRRCKVAAWIVIRSESPLRPTRPALADSRGTDHYMF